MGERIKAFAKNRDMPLYTFAEDIAASGGYWLLCIGTHTYAHPSSLVGSIGVISQAAAFKGVLEKNKIQHNEVTSSENLLEHTFDPWSRKEVSPEIVEKIKSMQAEIFVSFRQHVLDHRAAQFEEANYPQIFSADVVLGEKAKELGLVDEIGSVESVLKEKYDDLKVVDFSKEKPWEKFMARVQESTAAQLQNMLLNKAFKSLNRQ